MRRLSKTDTMYVKKMSDLGVGVAKIRKHMEQETMKVVTCKDIHNMRQRAKKVEMDGRNDVELLLDELETLLQKDPSSHVSIGESKGSIESVFFQTGSMRDTYRRFPEVLLLDGTYTVNQNRMPLYVFMVMDGYGFGRCVGYCFISSENKDVVKAALQCFIDANSSETELIKTVILDKDAAEISSVKEVIPNASIQLCLFHVLKTFKKETSRPEFTEREQGRKILEQMVYCKSIDQYNDLLEQLKSIAPESFMQYFYKNWHNCPLSWTHFDRIISLNLGNHTNNRLESQNQKIKTVLSRNTLLYEAVKNLLFLHQNKESLIAHIHFECTAKTAYKVGNHDEVTQHVLNKYTPYSAERIVKELHASTSIESHTSTSEDGSTFYFSCNMQSSYDTTDHSCNCSIFKSLGLPCKHIFYVRRYLGMECFTDSLVLKRWLLQTQQNENCNPLDTSQGDEVQVKNFQICSRVQSVPLSKEDKYTHALSICKEICDMVSLEGGREFSLKLDTLKQLTTLWKKGEVVILSTDDRETGAEISCRKHEGIQFMNLHNYYLCLFG